MCTMVNGRLFALPKGPATISDSFHEMKNFSFSPHPPTHPHIMKVAKMLSTLSETRMHLQLARHLSGCNHCYGTQVG